MAEDIPSENLNRRITSLEEQMRLLDVIDRELTQGINLYRFIVENSHIGIFIIDDQYRIVYGNNELVHIMGYPLDEVIGRDFRNFIAADNKTEVTDRYTRRQKGEILPHRYEVNTFRKDGVPKTVEISVAVTRSFADRTLSVVQVFDITERKQMEAELLKSRKKYHDIFQNVFDLIFIHDLDGVFLETNAQYVIKMGGTRDFLQGKNIREFLPEDYHPNFDRYLKGILETGAAEGLATVQIPGGGKRVLEYKNALMRDGRGVPTGVWGLARDITERTLAEFNLLKIQADLEETVRDRTQGLEEANIAMKVLLKKRDEDRRDLEDQMVVNIREMILPYMERLRNTPLKENQKIYLEIIERNLMDIASPFLRGLSRTFHKLTPAEIQIITLIKQDKTSKEISDFLNISPRTVEFHRDNIRKKLGIKNQKINLRSYLLSIT